MGSSTSNPPEIQQLLCELEAKRSARAKKQQQNQRKNKLERKLAKQKEIELREKEERELRRVPKTLKIFGRKYKGIDKEKRNQSKALVGMSKSSPIDTENSIRVIYTPMGNKR